MKKRFLIAGLALASLSLAACNKKEEAKTTNTNNTVTESVSTDTEAVDDYKLKVSTPSGAPLMAISGAKDDIDLKLVADTTLLPGLFQKTEEKEDIIIAPVNVGTKLYNANLSTYKLASVITWGNTYFSSGSENFTIDSMNGKTVTFFGKGSINVAIAKYVLKQKAVTVTEAYPDPDVVASIKGVLEANSDEMVMIAEPVLTVTQTSLEKQGKSLTSYSIANEYKSLTNHKYPQAAIFVNPDSYQLHKGKFDEFFEAVENTTKLVKSDVSKLAKLSHEAGIPQGEAVLQKAIPGCGIEYVKGSVAKSDVNYAATLADLTKYFGDKAPEDSFYLI